MTQDYSTEHKLTIIVVPTERCNLFCQYCFEPEDQKAKGAGFIYDFDAIKKSLLEVWKGPYHGSDVCLHGGECTMIPIAELEKLCSLIFNLPWSGGKVKGSVSMVTNATLITDDHIKLFKKYNVHPGVSCDGPPELNVLRGPDPSNSATTAAYNAVVNANIRKMRGAGVPVSVMCIVHSRNAATREQRAALGGWMLGLKKLGVGGGRVNPVTSDSHPEFELTQDQLFQMWVDVYGWNKQYGMQWNPVVEMERNLTGENRNPAPCINARCDVFSTHTLSILPDGTIGNCDRTFGMGMNARCSGGGSCGRYEALAQTECKGCPWWSLCGGGCPLEAVGGDWRRKTRWCGATKKMYDYIDKEITKRGIPRITPPELNAKPQPTQLVENSPHGDEPHGDDTHGDIPHGDDPHGDSNHGDTPDWRVKA